MIKIRIINSTWGPKDKEYFSSLILSYDNWDDYGYKTLFRVYYCNENGISKEIGELKIYCYDLKVDQDHVKDYLEYSIDQLSENFCSLGQEISYYRNLQELIPFEYNKILKRMNDIAVNSILREKFINEKGVQSSLLRFSGAVKALYEAHNFLEQIQEEQDISFEYEMNEGNGENSIVLKFDFKRNDYLPYRINVIIGKNGVGKTTLLSKLANSLSGVDRIDDSTGYFINGRPHFDKVMSISYSAFDSFKKIESAHSDNKRALFSYIYCGIQSENGTLSLDELRENFMFAFQLLKEKNRYEVWKEIMSELLESEYEEIISRIENNIFNIEWSSGQHILISTITELVANIENESIILFDEPEIHLHPNAIANLMRTFYRLLDAFNSYAIFSTHSPIVVQEIPSRYIQVLDKLDAISIVRSPQIECFGENISNIISDIFDVSYAESNYKTIINKMTESLSEQEIKNLFNNQLSLNALIYLKSCYNRGI